MPAAMHKFYLRNMYHRNVLKNPGGISLANVTDRSSKNRHPNLFSCRPGKITSHRGTRPMQGTQLVSGPARFVLGPQAMLQADKPAVRQQVRLLEQTKKLPADPEAWLAHAIPPPGLMVDGLGEVDRRPWRRPSSISQNPATAS